MTIAQDSWCNKGFHKLDHPKKCNCSHWAYVNVKVIGKIKPPKFKRKNPKRIWKRFKL